MERKKADQGKDTAECTRRISIKHNVTLATTTDIRYVIQGIIGESPLNRGVPG